MGVAAQLSSHGQLVGCGQHLPPPGGVMVFGKPRRQIGHRVIAVSAQNLRTIERCNTLLTHVGENSQLVLLIAAGSRLHSSLERMVVDTCIIPPSTIDDPPEKDVVYNREAVPSTPVELRVVSTRAKLDLEAVPEPDIDSTVRNFPCEGVMTAYFPRQIVRACKPLKHKFAVAGISVGMIGVIEMFSNHGWPIVRFANSAVVLMDEELTPKGLNMPLRPCNSLVVAGDIAELPRLPARWTIVLDEGCIPLSFQHLMI